MQNDWCNLLQAVRHSSSYSEAADLIFLLCCHLIFPLSYFSQVLEVEIFINSEFIKRWKKKSQVLSDRVKNGTCDISFSPLVLRTNFTLMHPKQTFLCFWPRLALLTRSYKSKSSLRSHFAHFASYFTIFKISCNRSLQRQIQLLPKSYEFRHMYLCIIGRLANTIGATTVLEF